MSNNITKEWTIQTQQKKNKKQNYPICELSTHARDKMLTGSNDKYTVKSMKYGLGVIGLLLHLMRFGGWLKWKLCKYSALAENKNGINFIVILLIQYKF